MSDSATSAAARGATYLIALQVSSRALTFLLNQILLRFLTPATLGRAVQLELYSISVLFFSRESLRVAVQRVGTIPSGDTAGPEKDVAKDAASGHKSTSNDASTTSRAVQSVVNLSYLSLVVGIPLSLFLGYLSWNGFSSTPAAASTPYIGHALLFYGLAAVIELASEPGFVAAQSLLLFKVRAGAEAAATIVKTFFTVGSTLLAHQQVIDPGVIPFAIGQLAFATTLLVYYALKMAPQGRQDRFSLFPTFLAGAKQGPTQSRTPETGYLYNLFSRPLLRIATSLTIQSSLKYVLTQGDSLLITALASLQDQGSYALASNYGGLIARMLFQPIEEASRNLFAKLCAAPPASGAAPVDRPDQDRFKPHQQPTKRAGADPDTLRAARILTTILKIYLVLSIPIVALGPALASPLLALVAGQRWTALGAGDVLGAYAYYVPLLALNGVLEAFVSASAGNRDLYKQSVWMGLFFVMFAGTAWVGVGRLGLGAKGVVLVNGVNMVGRIAWCAWFVRRWFGERGVHFAARNVLPSAGSVAAGATVPFLLLRATSGQLAGYGVFGELVRVGAVGALLVGAIAVFEIGFSKECYSLIRSSG